MGLPHTRTRLSGLAALREVPARSLALLALLAHGQTLAHDLIERHELCREHGELVHAGDEHAHEADAPATASSESGAEHGIRSAAAGAEHDHEHCALAGSRSDLTIAPAQAGVQPAAPGAPTAIPVAASAPRASGASYRLAPKQSPPV